MTPNDQKCAKRPKMTQHASIPFHSTAMHSIDSIPFHSTAFHSIPRPRAPKNHLKTVVNTHKQTLKHRSKNAIFKIWNFVALLFFETMFERASQKRQTMSHFRKMEIVGLSEKTKIKCFADIPFHCIAFLPKGPSGPQGAGPIRHIYLYDSIFILISSLSPAQNAWVKISIHKSCLPITKHFFICSMSPAQNVWVKISIHICLF